MEKSIQISELTSEMMELCEPLYQSSIYKYLSIQYVKYPLLTLNWSEFCTCNEMAYFENNDIFKIKGFENEKISDCELLPFEEIFSVELIPQIEDDDCKDSYKKIVIINFEYFKKLDEKESDEKDQSVEMRKNIRLKKVFNLKSNTSLNSYRKYSYSSAVISRKISPSNSMVLSKDESSPHSRRGSPSPLEQIFELQKKKVSDPNLNDSILPIIKKCENLKNESKSKNRYYFNNPIEDMKKVAYSKTLYINLKLRNGIDTEKLLKLGADPNYIASEPPNNSLLHTALLNV